MLKEPATLPGAAPDPAMRERIATLEEENRQLKQALAEYQRRAEAAQKAKAAAERDSRSKSLFLANMSHEIRTPLTGVIGFASLLAKEVSGEHREFAQLIERSGRRLMDTLNSVLTIAKLEAEQVDVQLDLLNLAAEVEEIVLLAQPLAEEKALTLTFRSAPGAEDALVRLDRGALSSILYNLIGNAVKYTEQGGIEVIVGRAAGRVECRVQDTGIGIDPAFLPHLFDPFRQEQAGFVREGSGLGLAITKRLVELMGGTIRAESEKGVGSTLILSFAAAPEGGALPDQQDAPEAEPAETGLRLLIVEDNEASAFLLEQVLQPCYEVTLAADAEEALRLALEAPFDLFLIDINLGWGPSGAEVLKQLRALPTYRELPIVALTAYALPGDRERFLQMGFSTYLSKPFTVEELYECIHTLLPEKHG